VSTPTASGPIPGGGNSTTVPWVNDAGTSTGVTNQLIAYVSVGGVQQQFGPFGNNGDYWTDPRAINNAGQIVGDAWFPNTGGPHAFLYSGGMTQDLGTLGGTSSMATAISSGGVVVGSSQAPSLQPNESGPAHAFVYQNGVVTDLNPMLGSYESQALGINSSGVIVGQMQFGYFNNPWNAFMLVNGKVTNLNSLLPPGSPWTLVAATGINDLGQIIGVGNDNGVAATFLLTPSSLGDPPGLPVVPEPTSFIVFAGIVSAVIARRTVAARGTRS
jgi:probable HAF family extracellular repeat protein